MKLSAAILAGGNSSRMGINKAQLAFGKTTLLEHQVNKVKSLGITDIMVSGGAYGISGTRDVKDEYEHCGPLGGIHSCLKEARNDAVLFLSVDTPLVPETDLEKLILNHKNGITLLKHEQQEEPLIGIYDKLLEKQSQELLESGQTSPWKLIHQTTSIAVEAEGDPVLYSNCNTPEEYNTLCSFIDTQMK